LYDEGFLYVDSAVNKIMFSRQLSTLVNNTESALGAAVVNAHGIVIDLVSSSPTLVPESGLAEHGMVIQQLSALNREFPMGESICCRIRTADRITLLRRVGEFYFLALWIESKASVDKAAFQLRLAASDIQAAI
jgi:predicted regulator of Ras-like GTPase activity (Roadblock/LC7/MglB family)